jgi:hypothetical protein
MSSPSSESRFFRADAVLDAEWALRHVVDAAFHRVLGQRRNVIGVQRDAAIVHGSRNARAITDAAVCYSVVPDADGLILDQLLASVRSLRAYNTEMTILVGLYGSVPEKLLTEFDVLCVELVHFDSYLLELRSVCGRAAEALVHHPVAHKWMTLRALPAYVRRVLVTDTDTLWRGDVAELFDRYRDAVWYAREELHCRRSPLGYRAENVDEDALAALAREFGIAPIKPFNLGVCLLNRGVAHRLGRQAPGILELMWRFYMTIYAEPNVTGDRMTAAQQEVVRKLIAEYDPRLALPYPACNPWIVEEIAVWFVLSDLAGSSSGDFSADDVALGKECMSHPSPRWVVGHYFSGNLPQVRSHLRSCRDD